MGQTVSLPTGTWRETCNDYTFDETTGILIAKLRKENGTLSTSGVKVVRGMTLSNDNGKFVIHHSQREIETVLPAGNWSITCRNPILKNSVLSAELQKTDGSYVHSAIVVHRGAIIENMNGIFENISSEYTPSECAQTRTMDNSVLLPLGTWINSAKNVNVCGNKLTAQLQNNYGNWVHAEIVLHSKFMVLENNDGKFVVTDDDYRKKIDNISI